MLVLLLQGPEWDSPFLSISQSVCVCLSVCLSNCRTVSLFQRVMMTYSRQSGKKSWKRNASFQQAHRQCRSMTERRRGIRLPDWPSTAAGRPHWAIRTLRSDHSWWPPPLSCGTGVCLAERGRPEVQTPARSCLRLLLAHERHLMSWGQY